MKLASASGLAGTITAMAALMVQIGCTSMKERGSQAMEAGNYEQAVTFYEQSVARDPGDAEAVAGLRRSREQVLSQRLIQVRNARLAGNLDAAVSSLIGVFETQKKWEMTPGGGVAFTQQEEREMLQPHLAAKVESDLKGGFPLRAQSTLKAYSAVFDPVGAARIQARVQQSGKGSCETLRKELIAGKPYFSHWVANYCRFWGDTAKLGDAAKGALSDGLFGKMQLTVHAEALSPEVHGAVNEALSKAFRNSPWYDPSGKHVATASVTGSSKIEKSRDGIILEQPYQENESYIENAVVKKTRQVEYFEPVRTTDPATGQISEKLERRNRPEVYETVEPQTRKRPVSRTYRYPAFRVRQHLSLHLSAQFDLEGKPVEALLTDSHEAEAIEHDENQPKYGLKPKRADLMDASRWSRERVEQFAASFKNKVTELWVTDYCRDSGDAGTLAHSGNQVELCMRARVEPAPGFAEAWYQKILGLPYREARALLDVGM